MRKFLLLVVVLAAIGLVSCANNAGGGSGSDGGSSGNGGTSGQENLPNSQNWYVGTWQGQNIEYDDKIFSQKMEINTDGSWKFYITDTNTGKIYDYYTKPLTESTTGYVQRVLTR